jgi:hypothetical protein
MQFLKPIPEGFVYNLAYSKTNQAGVDLPENNKAASRCGGCGADCLAAG